MFINVAGQVKNIQLNNSLDKSIKNGLIVCNLCIYMENIPNITVLSSIELKFFSKFQMELTCML